MRARVLRGVAGAPDAVLVLALLTAGCGGGAVERTARTDAGREGSASDGRAVEESARPAPGFRFVDVTAEVGLDAFRQVNGSAEKPYILESVGGGVAFFDADGDGRLDVYLTNGGRLGAAADEPPPSDALFRNVGDRFVEATRELGLADARWSNGAFAVDVDGDGWTDLYVTNWGPNALLWNRGGERFEDGTERAGVGDERWSTGAAFLDHDRDGDLDLYVANYVEFTLEDAVPPSRQYRGLEVFTGPHGLPGARDTFYVNAGDGTFDDATERAGLADSTGYAFQCVAFDADEDGWLDLYVATDSTPNRLWRNGGDGTFADIATRVGLSHGKSGKAQAGMGVAVGDSDGDGRFDLFVTNFAEDYFTLYRGLGRGLFADVSMRSGVALPTWNRLGWGCGFVDLDHDADLDLFCVNGHVFPQVDAGPSGIRYHQANQVFENDGTGRYADVSALAGEGWSLTAASRGAAWGDYDEDGDLDLLIGNLDGSPTLLRNEAPPGRWLRLDVVATRGPRAAIGAVVELTAGGAKRTFPVGEGSGFLSTSDRRVHVGLGSAPRADEVVVHWPGRAAERFGPLDAGATHRLVEGRGEAARR